MSKLNSLKLFVHLSINYDSVLLPDAQISSNGVTIHAGSFKLLLGDYTYIYIYGVVEIRAYMEL